MTSTSMKTAVLVMSDPTAGGALYESVRHTVAGASCGCADVFGATTDVEACGLDLLKDNPVPGTSGLPSLRALVEDGYSILSF